MGDCRFILVHRVGGIPSALQSKLAQIGFSATISSTDGNSTIAFDEESFQRFRSPDTGTRIVLGKNSGADLNGHLSYSVLKHIVGACIIIDVSRNVEILTDAFNKILLFRIIIDGTTIVSDSTLYLHSILSQHATPNISQVIHHIVHSIPFGDETGPSIKKCTCS